jgi:putative DNA-invertase from lambdoid prophage Rac
MPNFAFVRVSTISQETQRQRNNISRYATANQLIIEQFIERKISVTKGKATKVIEELSINLSSGDILLVDEISRLGRGGIGESIRIIDNLIKQKIKIIIVNQGWVLNAMDAESEFRVAMLSYFARMEAEYISRRTREGLAVAKSKGRQLGAKRGKLQKSKLDGDIDEIRELIKLGVPITRIATKFNVGRTTITHFIKTRKLC